MLPVRKESDPTTRKPASRARAKVVGLPHRTASYHDMVKGLRLCLVLAASSRFVKAPDAPHALLNSVSSPQQRRSASKTQHDGKRPKQSRRRKLVAEGGTCIYGSFDCEQGLACGCPETAGRRLFGAPAATSGADGSRRVHSPDCTCLRYPAPPPPASPPPAPPLLTPPPPACDVDAVAAVCALTSASERMAMTAKLFGRNTLSYTTNLGPATCATNTLGQQP